MIYSHLDPPFNELAALQPTTLFHPAGSTDYIRSQVTTQRLTKQHTVASLPSKSSVKRDAKGPEACNITA